MLCKIKWLRNFLITCSLSKTNLTAANSEGWLQFSGKVHPPVSLGFFPQPGSVLPFHQEGKSLKKVPQPFFWNSCWSGNQACKSDHLAHCPVNLLVHRRPIAVHEPAGCVRLLHPVQPGEQVEEGLEEEEKAGGGSNPCYHCCKYSKHPKEATHCNLKKTLQEWDWVGHEASFGAGQTQADQNQKNDLKTYKKDQSIKTVTTCCTVSRSPRTFESVKMLS